jgi:hypothetical protein
VSELDPSQWNAFAAKVKHDLGKGVAWWSANLEASDWSDSDGSRLREALVNDLLATRRVNGAAVESVWEVWSGLLALSPSPWPPLANAQKQRIEAALLVLARMRPILADDSRVGEIKNYAADVLGAQTEIRDACSCLVRWARSQA